MRALWIKIGTVLVGIGFALEREPERRKKDIASEFKKIHDQLHVARNWISRDPRLELYANYQVVYHTSGQISENKSKFIAASLV